MRSVRTITGDAAAAMFALGAASTDGTPIVVDNTPGAERLFILNADGDVVEVMSSVPYNLRVAQGLITGVSAVHKFGHAPDGMQTTATDLWSRADATPTQQIWVAPTQARVHAIVSSSTDDDGNPVGTGARTLRVWGLTSWTAAEVSEDITLNGTGAVNTANSYVIIHRMKVLTAGTTSINVGTITATAATDSSVTAVILPNDGQTQMAIYGVPSIQTLYLTQIIIGVNDNVAQTSVDISLLVNESPNVSPLNVRFTSKIEIQAQNSGSSSVDHVFDPLFAIPGPAIVKLQGLASAADMDTYGIFEGYLVTN